MQTDGYLNRVNGETFLLSDATAFRELMRPCLWSGYTKGKLYQKCKVVLETTVTTSSKCGKEKHHTIVCCDQY